MKKLICMIMATLIMVGCFAGCAPVNSVQLSCIVCGEKHKEYTVNGRVTQPYLCDVCVRNFINGTVKGGGD